MNTKRMLEVAKEIETGAKLRRRGVGFAMFRVIWTNGLYMHEVVKDKYQCGTTCCIAGIACLMFGEVGTRISLDSAASLLGLSEKRASKLFLNSDNYVSRHAGCLSKITRKEAVAAIRKMVSEKGKRRREVRP